MTGVADVVPLVLEQDPAKVSMSNLVEATATGSLPMYLLLLVYENYPYLVSLLLLGSLIVFLVVYYRMMAPKKKSGEAKGLLQGRTIPKY
jgi:hypothetical protein